MHTKNVIPKNTIRAPGEYEKMKRKNRPCEHE